MKKSSLLGYITGFGIGLASLIPGTVKDKASIDDVVANLQPQNSQEQVNESNYIPESATQYAKNVVQPQNAYGGGMEEKIEEAKDRCERQTNQNNCIFVDDYYKLAEPVNDPDMPEGLRKHPYGAISGSGPESEIETRVKKDPTNYDNKKFNDLLFGEYRDFIRETFSNFGYEPNKVDNFVKSHRDNDVSFYHDGYMLLFDKNQKEIYILNVGKDLIKELM